MVEDGNGTSSGRPGAGRAPAHGGRASGAAAPRGTGRAAGRAAAKPTRAAARPAARSTSAGSGGASGAGGSSRSRPTSATRPRPSARALTVGPDARPSSGWVRGAALLSILVLLAVTLLPTARSVIRQRSEISALHDNIAQQTTAVAGLKLDLERWKDPAYVEQQARERLKFVRPGEVSYSVIDPTQAAPRIPSGAVVAAPSSSGHAPWYGQLWTSMQLADRPTAGMDPVTDK